MFYIRVVKHMACRTVPSGLHEAKSTACHRIQAPDGYGLAAAGPPLPMQCHPNTALQWCMPPDMCLCPSVNPLQLLQVPWFQPRSPGDLNLTMGLGRD